MASYRESTRVECDVLQKILTINDNQLQLNMDGSIKDCDANKPDVQPCSADMELGTWKSGDLNRLKDASAKYLEGLKVTAPQPDRDDYTSMQIEMATRNFRWANDRFPKQCDPYKLGVIATGDEVDNTVMYSLFGVGSVLVVFAIGGIAVFMVICNRRRNYTQL